VIPTPPASFNGYGFVSVFDTNLATLLYSTLLGDPNAAPAVGGTTSEAFGVTVDPNGNFYVVGVTSSPSLPTTAGAFQRTVGVANSIPVVGFAAKFGPVAANGAALTYLTYLEATGVGFGDFPSDVAADSQGNAYVGGYTNSPTFPVTTGAYQTPCTLNGAGLCPAAFVTKVNPTGTGLVWSALVEPADFFSSIQLDTQGNVYVAGDVPGSDPFVTVNPVQPGLNHGGAFVAELDPTGKTLLFASLIQGGFTMRGLAVDAQENVYVTSYTYDTTLPTTPGAFQTALKNPGSGNSYDGFIAKIALNLPVVTLAPAGQVEAFAAESIMSVYGVNLASGTVQAATLPLPISLDGNSVTVTDSAGVARPAPLYFVSSGQINFEIPAGTAAGTATVTFQNQNGTIQSTTILIGSVSPGIFALNGSGLAAALALPVFSGVQQSLQPVWQLASGSVVALPVNLGPSTEQVYLELYGTGFRNAKNFTATVGGLSVPVLGAAATAQFVGEDQVNIGPLPPSLAGKGIVNIVITADGQASNTVNVTIQ
jgi:uncharacterized protein (TIGR03437 family)